MDVLRHGIALPGEGDLCDFYSAMLDNKVQILSLIQTVYPSEWGDLH